MLIYLKSKFIKKPYDLLHYLYNYYYIRRLYVK